MKKLIAAVLAAVIAFAPIAVNAEGSATDSGTGYQPASSATDSGTGYQPASSPKDSGDGYTNYIGIGESTITTTTAKTIAGLNGLTLPSASKYSIVTTMSEATDDTFKNQVLAQLDSSKTYTVTIVDITPVLYADGVSVGEVHDLGTTKLSIYFGVHFVGIWHQENNTAVKVSGDPTYALIYNKFSNFALVEEVTAASEDTTEWPKDVNWSLIKGATWKDPNNSNITYTSLGDGRYYNQFYTVFDGEGKVVGKYNPATGVVTAAATTTSVANGTYTVPNTADKN